MCLSSVQKSKRSDGSFESSQPRTSVERFFAALPSRTSTANPARSFSAASANVVHSCSVAMPSAAYACRSFPEIPGAWPSASLPHACASATFSSTPASPATAAG